MLNRLYILSLEVLFMSRCSRDEVMVIPGFEQYTVVEMPPYLCSIDPVGPWRPTVRTLSAPPFAHSPIVANIFEKFTTPTVIEQVSYILIAAGAFVFVVSFLGYCGAIRESRCLLTTYGVLLLIILVMEITAGGLAAAYKKEAETESRTMLKNSIKKYYATQDKADAVTLMWNYFMAQMKCCGVDNYLDFKESPKWGTNKTVPEACCVLVGDLNKFTPKDPQCPNNPSESNSYYMKGCYETFYNWLMEHINTAIGVGIGLGLLQLLGIFFAFCLCKSIDGYIK
uniref:Tetraspanin n=1 Tax=Timema bartmani TaxID=61472 RepID=A0A7R9EVB7_9NEOP|nr:unnamed protein product [Timema bartmani]